MLWLHFVVVEQIVHAATIHPLIAHADAEQRSGANLAQYLGDRRAKPADNRRILRCDRAARLPDRAGDQLAVQRLDRPHVDDLGADAIASQQVGGLQAFVTHESGAKQRDIRTWTDDVPLAPLKLV